MRKHVYAGDAKVKCPLGTATSTETRKIEAHITIEVLQLGISRRGQKQSTAFVFTFAQIL